MRKNFVKSSILMVTVTAVLSVIFAILFYLADNYLVDPLWLVKVSYYAKRTFDLLAVFTGYSIIIYAYSRYQAKDAIYSLGIFGISVFISYVYQVVGACIDQGQVDLDFVIYSIYFSLGSCVISQLLPGVLVAFLTYKLTKQGAKRLDSFISWRNPIHKCMIITTLVIFGINMATHLGFNVLPFLIEHDWSIYEYEFWDIILTLVDYTAYYVLVQYSVYVLGYYLCYRYGENHVLPKNSK